VIQGKGLFRTHPCLPIIIAPSTDAPSCSSFTKRSTQRRKVIPNQHLKPLRATQLQVTRNCYFIFGAQALACLFLSSKCRLKPAPHSYVYSANQDLLLRGRTILIIVKNTLQRKGNFVRCLITADLFKATQPDTILLITQIIAAINTTKPK